MSSDDTSHILYRNDLSDLPLGPFALPDPKLASQTAQPLPTLPGGLHIPNFSRQTRGGFTVTARGLGKYIETDGGNPESVNRILAFGDSRWRDYRVRAVLTPLDFENGAPGGGICGIVARYRSDRDYLALVLDRDGQLKILQRVDERFEVLASKALDYCLGQSLTLTLEVAGNSVHGEATPYSGAVKLDVEIPAANAGFSGWISDVHARFGPVVVETSAEEVKRIAEAETKSSAALISKRAKFSKAKIERDIPLHGLVNGRNLQMFDVDGDGNLEVVVAQSSRKISEQFSLTRTTCLSVLDLKGELRWQAGIHDPGAPLIADELPFLCHDLYGPAVACVFGYDLQIRDGKTGRVLLSAASPEMSSWLMPSDFKNVTSNFGHPWGDEKLNMNVAALAFCDTLGKGKRTELVVQDDAHHLAVLDVLAHPAFHVLFKHRGNVARKICVADIDNDGKDEIIAGGVALDHDGRSLWKLPCADATEAVFARTDGSVLVAAGNSGLLASNSQNTFADILGARALRFAVARFRSDLPGEQTIVSTPGQIHLLDSSGKRLWSRDFFSPGQMLTPVNWMGKHDRLILGLDENGPVLIDGFGDAVVELPKATFASVAPSYVQGRDAILVWDKESAQVIVPE